MNKIKCFLLFGLIIVSCSKNNDSPEVDSRLVTRLNGQFLLTSNGYIGPEDFISFEYNSAKKLTKKIGGFIPLASVGNLSEIYTNKIYSSLTYTNNKVTIEDFSSSPDFTVNKNTKYLTLNSSNQIITKEIPSDYNHNLKTLTYTYQNNKLSEIKTTFPNRPSDPNTYILTYLEKFYFDTKGNLTKTEFFEQQNGVNKGMKVIRTFEDYDNSSNPCKRLFLIDEYFYRSLSVNNFRKFTEKVYYYTENGYDDKYTYEKGYTWSFPYDTNGQIIIN